LIGPGLSKEKETLMAVKKFVSTTDKSLVLDADALSVMKGRHQITRKFYSNPTLWRIK